MPDPLQRYIGKSRVLLVFAPGEDDPALREQRRILASAAQEARQRDLVVVEILGGVSKTWGITPRAGLLGGQIARPAPPP